MKKVFLLLLFFLFSMSQAQKTETFMISDKTISCEGVTSRSCMLVKKDLYSDWEYFYDPIHGFDYQPGYQYKIEVEVTERTAEETPADASSHLYRLKKILKKKKAPEDFPNASLKLIALQRQEIDPVEEILFSWNNKEHAVYIQSSYNKIRIPYSEQHHNSLHMQEAMATRQLCTNEQTALEKDLFHTFQNTVLTYELILDNLVLKSNDSVVAILQNKDNWSSFKKYISKNNWKLIQMNGNHDRVYNQKLKIDFDTMHFWGQSGCNRFSGSIYYDFDNQTLDMRQMILTELWCNSHELEKEFIELLSSDPLHFDVAEQTLNFYKDNRLVLMFALYKE